MVRDSLADLCERHLRAGGGDHAARKVNIDVDSSPIAVHGDQPWSPGGTAAVLAAVRHWRSLGHGDCFADAAIDGGPPGLNPHRVGK